jgi:ferritin-like metal-binding protein YciE
MSASGLRALFIDELKGVYDAERLSTKALPRLADAAQTSELVDALESHLEQTQEHISRLEQVFRILGERPVRKPSRAMVHLLEQSEELIEKDAAGPLRDVALITAAQRVEHFELATYGCLRAWAELLGESAVMGLLQKTLDEERKADGRLKSITDGMGFTEFVLGLEEEPVVAHRRSDDSLRPMHRVHKFRDR